MATKKTAAKKTVTKKAVKKPVKKTPKNKLIPVDVFGGVTTRRAKLDARIKNFLKRRPHRSFRMTARRDYKRSFKLPGYWAFINIVRKFVWQNKKVFGGMVFFYVMASVVIGGFGAQDVYSDMAATLRAGSGDLFSGNFGEVGQAGLLLAVSVTQGISPNLTEAQAILGGLMFFFVWLATVWLSRNLMAGHRPKVRDALYNCGSPIISTVIIGFIIMVQLLPAAIALIVFEAAYASGFSEVGVVAMLAWIVLALFSLLSIYWVIGSLVAMVIVTLPGMYPLQAIRAAGDMIVGRRFRVLLRVLWLAAVFFVIWVIIMIPLILFDDWLKKAVPAVSWLPLVPIALFTLSSATVVFSSTYIYLLYRRLVDDDSAPA